MCTNIDTVISLIIVYVIGFLCIALVGYRVGCWIGEKTAYKRFDRICNECRNSCKKCNSSEKSNS
jgi:hypothetical protein